MKRRGFLKLVGLASAAAASVSIGAGKALEAISAVPLLPKGRRGKLDAWTRTVRPSGNYQIKSGDDVITVDANKTLTLPAPSSDSQLLYIVPTGGTVDVVCGTRKWSVEKPVRAISNGKEWFVV